MSKIFNSDTPRDHLYLPDRQATANCGNEIDHAVGNYIVKHRPAVIIDAGDHADMPSLSLYDVGKKCFEGRRYKVDVEASIHAHEIQFKPLWDLQAEQGKDMRQRSVTPARLAHCVPEKMVSAAEIYDPLRIISYGNHENRIVRAVEDDPKLDGLMALEHLQYNRFFHYVSPFLEPVIVDGICYVHYAYKKMPHKAMEGEMSARNILKQNMVSTTVGHSPEFQYFEMFNGLDQRIQCMVAGMRGTHNENYAGPRNRRYWRGIVHKRNVMNGTYDFERISTDTLLRDYL